MSSAKTAVRGSRPVLDAQASVPIRLIGAAPIGRRGEPVTMGVPLPKGSCTDARRLGVIAGTGQPLPLQARVLDRWSDGSIRWALLDFQADVDSAGGTLQFVIGAASPPPEPLAPVACREREGVIDIDTSAAVFRLQAGRDGPFRSITVDGSPVVAPERTGFSIESREGRCALVFDEVVVEEAGSLRTVVRARGRAMQPDASALAALEVRLHFFAGSATVRIVATVRNPRAAAHPGGYWELGDPGSIYLRDLAFNVGLVESLEIATPWSANECSVPAAPVSLPFELYQESSGGREWQHANHRNRDGVVPLRWRGYRVRSGEAEATGERASPIVGGRVGARSVAMTLPLFWQNFPKAIEATSRDLSLRLFPHQFGDVHELQGGEQKTHTFFVAFDTDRVTPLPLDWCRAPLGGGLPPSWYCEANVVPYLAPRAAAPDGRDELIDAAIDPATGFVARRETIDEYGWRHYGDLYADHEAVFQPGAAIVSHYNNQYDAVAGFAREFMRTGDRRWWSLMDDLARHVADIDIYHTDADKAAYNNGLFWHTYHYVDAGLSSHRSYPKSGTVCGGGPSNEHNYATGLMLHYFLTGDPVSREAAIGLARWVVAMDDGRQTVFRWLTRTPTGLASQTQAPEYHGPGRGAGHSVRALLDGHRLTGDPSLLLKAEQLIRRVIHPADNLEARQLLDAERRWSYTALLQALGVYLDDKLERGERDAMYEYARASLLHYARWMAVHEYPYLDKPEILEYPTETWAAQDLRKSDVFYLAARLSTAEEATRFLARGAFFYTTAIATLRSSSTRALARPVVLVLSNGALHACQGRYAVSEPARDAGAGDPGRPQRFAPQKQRAKQRLAALAGAGLVILAAFTGWLAGVW